MTHLHQIKSSRFSCCPWGPHIYLCFWEFRRKEHTMFVGRRTSMDLQGHILFVTQAHSPGITYYWEPSLRVTLGVVTVLTWSLRFLWNPTSSLKLSKSSLDKASLGLCEVLLRVKVLSWVLKAPFMSLANWGLANLNPFLDQVWA